MTTEHADHEIRYEELGARRYQLGEKAEEQMQALLGTLGELRDLDAEQQREARAGGFAEAVKISDFGNLIRPWLSSRLGGPGDIYASPGTSAPTSLYRNSINTPGGSE